jgi:zinc protease
VIIAIVGAVEPQKAVEQVSRALGDWENPRQPDPPTLPPVVGALQSKTRKVEIPGKYQADVVLGAVGPERRSPDFLAASLGNNILGQFGMMGRIGEAVREKAGLAYYAYSTVSGGLGPGPWYVTAGVDPANVERAVELIQAEVTRFTSKMVSEQELVDSQSNFVGRLPLSLESNSGVASVLFNLERYDLGLDYYRRYPDLVRGITRDEILETARRYLSTERMGVAIAGP